MSAGPSEPRRTAGAAVDPPQALDSATAPEGATVPKPAAPSTGLSDRELRILDFERQWWKHPGAKEQAIRDGFGMSATRYYQLLNALIDKPEALAHDPMLVKRLLRRRTQRRRGRTARQLGIERP